MADGKESRMARQERQEYLEYKYKEICKHQDWAMCAEGNDAKMNAMFDWLNSLTDAVGTIIEMEDTDDGK